MADSGGRRGWSLADKLGALGFVVTVVAFVFGTWTETSRFAAEQWSSLMHYARHGPAKPPRPLAVPAIDRLGTPVDALAMVVRTTSANESEAYRECARPGRCFYVMTIGARPHVDAIEVDDIVVDFDTANPCGAAGAADLDNAPDAEENLRGLMAVARGDDGDPPQACATVIRRNKTIRLLVRHKT